MEPTVEEAPEETVPPPISDETSLQQIDSWRDFTEKTTFHGIRYIFEKPALRFRRRIWLLVVITALSVFVIQVGIRTGNYLEYKTSLDVEKFYTDHLEFPAITICNQNRYRTTAVVEHGLYDVVDEVFKRTNISKIPWEKFGDRVNGIDYREFTLQTGHQKHNFIDSCTWNGVDCDIDKDFKAVLTDLGLCYTFNGQKSIRTVHTREAGAGSGLKLVINIEQYEYMRGPQDDAGIKILLHPREETPIMQEQGFAAAPGSHTLVAMKRSEVTTLQPPYGICHPNNSPVSQCYAQCEARDIINVCSCQTEYMQPISENATEMTETEWECACRPPCKQVQYDPQLSYAQLSKFNIDRTILDNPEKEKRLEESYLKARETTQRYREEIRSKDEADMTRLVKLADKLRYSLQNIREKTTDPLTTSCYFNLPAIMALQFFHSDYITITEKMKKLEDSIETFFGYWEGFLSDILFTEEHFLEWDGSVFRFHQFLIVCLEEATAAQQNYSVDGSGDVDLDLQNNSMIHVPPKCKTELNFKKLMAAVAGFEVPDFEKVVSTYQNIVASTFENTIESSDEFNNHTACQYAFDLTAQEASIELHNSQWNFGRAETLEDYMSVTNKMIITVKVLRGARDNLLQCLWLVSTYANTQALLSLVFNLTTPRYTTFFASFNTMSKTMISMAEGVEGLGNPIFEMITAYMNETGTKMELAKAIGDLAEFRNNGYIVIELLQEKLITYLLHLHTLYGLINRSPLTILNMDEFQNLKFFKLAYDTNRTEFQHLIDGLSDNRTNVEQLFTLLIFEYQLRFQELLGAIPGAFTEISDHLDMFRHELQVENFLQLDIFYKDMSYEVIAQQEAFGLLSLLGEVGGFLGLLLGASVITVCELLDYLLLNVATRCAGHRKEKPDVVKRQNEI